MDIVIRADEGCDPDPFLLWDSIWDPQAGAADWALADAAETLNRGGLAARRALATAVTLCLFTDRRVPAGHHLAWLADGDPRGWWGDGVDVRDDLHEGDLGSLLWLLERAPLTEAIGRFAEAEALEALAPILRQGAAVRADAQAVVHERKNRLELFVQLYGRDGQAVYDGRFDFIWRQLDR